MGHSRWLVFSDEILLSRVLSQRILNIAEDTIKRKGCFNIVVTGGNSVAGLYQSFSQSVSAWDKWNIYISDERCVPVGHRDRNDQMIKDLWLDNVGVPEQNIHFIKSELRCLEAQKDYEEKLKKIKEFDVVLLSMGEDGHVASLFPGHLYKNNRTVIIERDSPKPPRKRISMSYLKLSKARYVFKLIVGKKKKKCLALLKRNANLPVVKVSGKSDFFVTM